MASHARYSPSKLEGLEACPCFDYKQDEDEDDVSPDADETPAQRGTRLHKAVETEDTSLCCDEDEIGQVTACIEYMQSLAASSQLPLAKTLREHRVTIPDLTYGTLDHGFLWGPEGAPLEADITDFKFIRVPSVSSPEDNFQLACYAVGLLIEYPSLQRVRATLLAPGLRYLPEPAVFTRDHIDIVKQRIAAVLQQVADPFKQPSVCDFCKQCANAARCPALGGTAVAVARQLKLPVPDSFVPGARVSLDDRAVAQFLATALEQWAKETKANNRDHVLSGGEVPPGFKLVTRAGSSVIRDTGSALTILQDGSFVPWSVLRSALKLSVPKLVAATVEHHKKSPEAVLNQLREVLGPILEQQPDIKFLQRERSKRSKALLQEPTTEVEK